MIYLIYLENDVWSFCETYAQLIREVNRLKCFNKQLIKDHKIKIISYKKNADITKQVKEMLNS